VPAAAFGVPLDTLVVRSLLVTALNLDLGRWVWWPSRLYRQPAPEVEEPLEEEPAAVR
jgi:RND superfamily putative drug exporter